MARFINFHVLKVALLSVLFITSCKTVPLTGRKQLSLVSESEVMTMSLSQYDQFIKSNKISLNKAETDRVRSVVTNMPI